MTWELILDGYSESSYSATPRFAAARLPWFSNRLKIQLQIDELRAELAGTRDAQKREDLRKKLESLERQKKSLR
ncbi:hypothetical protein [Escherichia coli]|uniref:hypothetical protein n=1 Tax=Escherichia coli TaxID=562 RepID=UPI0020C1F856|nr:hypothetical protein [Escherichia coli]